MDGIQTASHGIRSELESGQRSGASCLSGQIRDRKRTVSASARLLVFEASDPIGMSRRTSLVALGWFPAQRETIESLHPSQEPMASRAFDHAIVWSGRRM